MLTDSGVNAMSDKQLAAMMDVDDSYAGSETYTEFEEKSKKSLMKYVLPAHQGRACENLLVSLVRPGTVVPRTILYHLEGPHYLKGGRVEELIMMKAPRSTAITPSGKVILPS